MHKPVYKAHYIECDCGSMNDLLKLSEYDEQYALENPDDCIVSAEIVVSADHRITKRFIQAFKFIFGGKVYKHDMLISRYYYDEYLNLLKKIKERIKTENSIRENGILSITNEHILTIYFDEVDDNFKFVGISVFLNWKRSLYSRFMLAIKHMFGYDSRYGCFESFDIDGDAIMTMIKHFEKMKVE